MNPIRLLAKLPKKGMSFEPVITGGVAGITWEDVAGALGYGDLSLPAYWYGRIKYVGDTSSKKMLLQWISSKMDKKLTESGKSTRFSISISAIAMMQSIAPINCRRCRGRGEHPFRNGAVVRCDKCEGSGLGEIPLTDRAGVLGISRQNYSKTWRNFETYGIRRLATLDNEVLGHLTKQFNKND